ncbi:MAG: hypothetical protein AAGG55_11980 [Pseudomonadota bacterium]
MRDRHVIVACIVTPLLAVMAWFGAGALTGERAAAPRPGHSYPLVAHSNCRYASGICTLSNEDLKLNLTSVGNGQHVLELESSHALDSAVVALTSTELPGAPSPMEAQGGDGRRWQAQMAPRISSQGQMRLAVTRQGSAFYIETGTEFLRQAVK